MGGLFGVVTTDNCMNDLFFGVDYHSHLGTTIGGLAILSDRIVKPVYHDLSNSQFKTEFRDDFGKLDGHLGIGVISSTADDKQPLVFRSKLGTFALCTDSLIKNAESLMLELVEDGVSFKEVTERINQTELIGELICRGNNITAGIATMYEKIDGTVSLLLLSEDERCIYASSGVFPLVIGKRTSTKGDNWAVASETTAFPNLNYESYNYLRYKNIASIDGSGFKIRKESQEGIVFCPFLHVYFDFPASSHYGINGEIVRERCGGFLVENDDVKPSLVMGVADSGIPHAHGYAKRRVEQVIEQSEQSLRLFERGAIGSDELTARLRELLRSIAPLRRPVIKFTAGWGRSYIPPQQSTRDLIAYYKQVPNSQLISNQSIVLVDDSIRRGTQLRRFLRDKIWPNEPKEVHGRIASPPQLFACYFDGTTEDSSLIARKAVEKIETREIGDLSEYQNPTSEKYKKMVQIINQSIGTTSLKFISLDNMIRAIIEAPGNVLLQEKNLCTYCWTGKRPRVYGAETPSHSQL